MKFRSKICRNMGLMLICYVISSFFGAAAEAKLIKETLGNKGISNKPVVTTSKKTDKKLEKKLPTEPSNVKLQKVTPTKNNVKTYKQGETGWKVKVAQQKLLSLGLSKEKPNGTLTSETARALLEFQKQQKLLASGKLDPATYSKLTWVVFTKEGIKNVTGWEIVQSAAKYKGVPYVFGGTTPSGFDCSGYVQFVFRKHNAQLPRVADEQVLKGLFITQSQLKPGDLVFFTTYAPGASHVGIYAGKGQFWHTSSSRGVMLSSLYDVYWKPRYYGARRVLVSNGEI